MIDPPTKPPQHPERRLELEQTVDTARKSASWTSVLWKSRPTIGRRLLRISPVHF